MLGTTLQAIEDDAASCEAEAFAALAASFLRQSAAGTGEVSPSAAPDELLQCFDPAIPETGQPLADVLRRVERDVLAGAIRLSHPMYLGHQVSAPLPAAIWSETIIAAMNNSMAVREMSPSATPLETALVRACARLAGWGEASGGTCTSGGTEATLTALLAARARAMPESWTAGIGDQRPILVAGEHSHYAVTRAAGILGLGTEAVRSIRSREHRMDVAALRSALDEAEREHRPVLAVVATAGSTGTGSFDDLDGIADITNERGIWLHVDGAHGASALVSERHRHRMQGVARADSLAWDPHKMLLTPLGLGMLLVRDERALDRAFAQQAPYLFHGGQGARNWDLGMRSFQCSRPFDALKLWVSLQRYGRRGLESLYDHLCDLALELHAMLEAHGALEPLHRPEANILCFRWAEGNDTAEEADRRQLRLRSALNASGQSWITTTRLDGRQVLRVTIMNPRTTPEHLRHLVDALDACAGRLPTSTE